MHKNANIVVGPTCRSTYQHACQIVYNSEGLIRNMAQIIHIYHISALFFYHRSIEYKALSFVTIRRNVASPKDLDQESQRRGREVEELEKRLAYAAAESRPDCQFSIAPIPSMLSKLRWKWS